MHVSDPLTSPPAKPPRMSSSPFIEHPYNGSDITPLVAKLEFRTKSLATELKLAEAHRKELISSYDSRLQKKTAEFDALKQDFDFVYSQKKEMESKIANQEQIANSKKSQIELDEELKTQHIKRLELEILRLSGSLLDTKKKCLDREKSFGFLEDENTQLHRRISEYEDQLRLSLAQVDDLLTKQKRFQSAELSSAHAVLLTKCDRLEKQNIELRLQLDENHQHKTSNEVLKQKYAALHAKFLNLQSVQEQNCKLEIENMSLKQKFDDFHEIFNEQLGSLSDLSVDGRIVEFIDNYKSSLTQNAVLQDKYNQISLELQQNQSKIAQFEQEQQENSQRIKSLNMVLNLRQELIEKLERQKLLNSKEIEFLRELLKELDAINLKRSGSSLSSEAANANTSYISKLERLVDEYKSEKEAMLSEKESKRQKENQDEFDELSANKRQRLEHSSGTISSMKSNISKLEQDNVGLLVKIQQLENDKAVLVRKLETSQQIRDKRDELKVVQLRLNPLARDQVVKQQTLDALRKENDALLNSVLDEKTWVPKAVFERQENDIFLHQQKVEQYAKRINRLKDAYAKKSYDILTIISKFFGYSVEFLPSAINPEDLTSSRIKLTSKLLKKRITEGTVPHLIIDVYTKSLKVVGSEDFKLLCQGLLEKWVKGKDLIPCFLSALNLEISDDIDIYQPNP